MKTLRQYQCEICETIYDEQSEAEDCEAQPMEEAEFQVGDFVVTDKGTYGRFGWYDGDAAWVIEKEEGLHGPCKCYSLIYVITAILIDSRDRHLHRLCYHLASKGMTGEQGYRDGHTYAEGHYHLHKVQADLDASDLIGREALWLV